MVKPYSDEDSTSADSVNMVHLHLALQYCWKRKRKVVLQHYILKSETVNKMCAAFVIFPLVLQTVSKGINITRKLKPAGSMH